MTMNFKYDMMMIPHIRFDDTTINEPYSFDPCDATSRQISPAIDPKSWIEWRYRLSRTINILNWDKQAIVTMKMSGVSILTISYLVLCLISFQLNKLDMPEELGDVKTGLVRRTPSSKVLVGKHLRARNRSEEIHPPLSTACTARINIKQTQRNLCLADPFLRLLIKLRLSLKSVTFGVGNEKVIKRRSFLADLGRIVDEGLVSHVVWIDFVLEIRLRIVGALVDERFHDFVGPDIIVCSLRFVEVEVFFVQSRERQREIGVRVAEIDLRTWKRITVGDGFREFDAAIFRTCWHID